MTTTTTHKTKQETERRGEREKGWGGERGLFLSQLLCVQERRGGRGKITAKTTQQHLTQNLTSRLSRHQPSRRQHKARQRAERQQGSCRQRMLQCKTIQRHPQSQSTRRSLFFSLLLPLFHTPLPSFLFLSFAERGLCFSVYSHFTFWMPWVIFVG